MTRQPAHQRFAPGDHVYLRPRSHDWIEDHFVVLNCEPHRGWPHYELMAPDGSLWAASQLELLRKPLSQRHIWP